MPKQRIQVYADPEIKRRIELAAAKRNTPVTEYCLQAIMQQLADDDMLDREQVTIAVNTQPSDALIRNLQELHARILARRNGALIDIDAFIKETQAEREHDLLGLH